MEPFIRNQSDKENRELLFQILSWEAFDEEVSHETSDFEESQNQDIRYHIYAFGINESGESVCVRFENYKPYFFAAYGLKTTCICFPSGSHFIWVSCYYSHFN